MNENKKLLERLDEIEREVDKYRKSTLKLKEILPLPVLESYMEEQKYYEGLEEVKKLLSEIKEYLSAPDICMNGEVISAYDLLEMMQLRFSDFCRVLEAEELKKEVNDSITKHMKITRKISGVSCECEHTIILNKDGKTSIGVNFPPNNWIYIEKDIESGNIHFGETNSTFPRLLPKNFIEQHYDCLNDYFNTIEDFLKASGFSSIDRCPNQYFEHNFSNELFSVEFLYSNDGRAVINVDIPFDRRCKLINADNIYEIFYNEEYKNEILKKFPIKISELDPVCKDIVEYYQGFQNKPQLIKKNNH